MVQKQSTHTAENSDSTILYQSNDPPSLKGFIEIPFYIVYHCV